MEDIGDSSHCPGPPSAIKAIDLHSVHRICSGQVVLTLATAVKELVENSIDAGATSIEVRLKDHGAELIEVTDNGHGVKEENFAGLTLKHHTSKLREFSDLTYVETFGFRGEALSSLCALSNVVVVTCHKDASVGTKLDFNNTGSIISQTPCARQCGTTVSLGQLFHTLPVRHKEFQRNLKREFTKMVHVLNAYCTISTGLRFMCTNLIIATGKKSVIISTNGNDSIKENITNIFGPKQFQSLLKFSQCLPSEQVCTEYSIKVPESTAFRVDGYVSSSEHGKGRGSSDRQFIFVNRRPCDLAKVTRIINDTYHSYNRHQSPFVVLDISVSKASVDVNVTPDKRQIFISEEKMLLAIIKTSLVQMFEPISSVYQVNQGQGTLTKQFTSPFPRSSVEGSSTPITLRKSASTPTSTPKISLTSALSSLKRSFSSTFAKSEDLEFNSCESPIARKKDKQRRLDTFIRIEQKSPSKGSPQCATLPQSPASIGPSNASSDIEQPTHDTNTHLPSDEAVVASCDATVLNSTSDMKPRTHLTVNEVHTVNSTEIQPTLRLREEPLVEPTPNNTSWKGQSISDEEGKGASKESCEDGINCSEELEGERKSSDESQLDPLIVVQHERTEYDQSEEIALLRNTRNVQFSMSNLRRKISQRQEQQCREKDKFRSFRAQINPNDNQDAEDELKKEIKKEMFGKMDILGQFNLGFIIAMLGSDLFIIDQHATDEKYNFEMLQQHTVIHSQKLIQPQKLELTAANSAILIDNIDIFRTNGFEFEIDEAAPITERVKLTTMPVSKNWTFGKDDIEELIFMLSDSPGVLCRPSRVRMMFASRACRKSIMIGTALNQPEMRKVLNHMGEIDQPWNCPHGRPTMRHLINLDCLQDLQK